MKIHSELGPGLLEKLYKEAMEYEFKINNIPFEREKAFSVHYFDTILPSKFNADFIVYKDLILEIKAKKEIADEDFAQTINYLKICRSPLSLIINFGKKSLEYKRIVN